MKSANRTDELMKLFPRLSLPHRSDERGDHDAERESRSDRPEKGWPVALTCTVGTLAVLTYVLSVPFAYIVCEKTGWWSWERVVMTVYLPLFWLSVHVKPIEEFYTWYCALVMAWMG